MSNISLNDCVVGQFVRELKNRFLCEVVINGRAEECYIPSSCHLGNFLQLEGKDVLLLPTAAKKSRTAFAVIAVKYKRSYVILNTSYANRLVEYAIQGRCLSYLGSRRNHAREKKIEDYKCDFYIEDTNTVIEVKSIISTSKIGEFPTVYSERTLKQLCKIKELLRTGYKVDYIIVSLNPYVKAIELIRDTEFYKEFDECINVGMSVHAFGCRVSNGMVLLDKKLDLL